MKGREPYLCSSGSLCMRFSSIEAVRPHSSVSEVPAFSLVIPTSSRVIGRDYSGAGGWPAYNECGGELKGTSNESRRFPVVTHSIIDSVPGAPTAGQACPQLTSPASSSPRQASQQWSDVSGKESESPHFLLMSVTYPPPERQFSVDEGRTVLSGEIQPSGSDHNMPPYVQHVDLEQVNPKPGYFVVSTSRAVWQRFNGHGRKRVGFFQSLKAVALSSCTFVVVATLLATHPGP